MKLFSTPTLALALTLGLALLGGAGCGSRSGGASSGEVRAAATEEVGYSATLRDATDVQSYEWSNARDLATVRFDATSIAGFVRVEVYDGRGLPVFDRAYAPSDSPVSVVQATAAGHPGRWRLIVSTLRASGRVSIRVS